MGAGTFSEECGQDLNRRCRANVFLLPPPYFAQSGFNVLGGQKRIVAHPNV